MEIRYKRDMKHNYLIIEPEDDWNRGFETRMMVSNSIEGLLRFRLKYLDTKEYYYYEITSRQPLARLLETHTITCLELRQLMVQIIHILARLDYFLLKEDQLLLEADYIYVTPDTFDVALCLVPGREEPFPETMTRFLQYLLGKVNHQDKECVVLAYGLYQESLKENYGMDDLLELLAVETGKGDQAEPVEGPGQVSQEDQKGGDWGEGLSKSRPQQSKPMDALGIPLWRILGFTLTLLLGSLVLYLILGVFRMLPYFVVLAAGAGLIWFAGIRRKGKQGKDTTKESWRLSFEEMEDRAGKDKNTEYRPMERLDTERETVVKTPVERFSQERMPMGERGDTVLLANLNLQENLRRLVSMDGGEDIVLSYYPFVIGKQDGVVDFVLNGEAVSRLHIKINYDEDGYKITDLNSTNGTKINNQLLEANETINLSIGDEIFVANVRFRFI